MKMSSDPKNKICPVEHAGVLDISIRKIFHNPRKILQPYITDGMTVLDLGCGPGFFTIEMAELAGISGKVTAADLQEGMLEKVLVKIRKSGIQNSIELHTCLKDRIGLSQKFDFILMFYMLHEIPDIPVLLNEIKSILKSGGKVLIVEPKFHVSKNNFNNSIEIIKSAEFDIIERPKILFSRAIVIKIVKKT